MANVRGKLKESETREENDKGKRMGNGSNNDRKLKKRECKRKNQGRRKNKGNR